GLLRWRSEASLLTAPDWRSTMHMLGAAPVAIVKEPVPAMFELVHPRLPAPPTTPALLLPPQNSSWSGTRVRSAALNGWPPLPPRTICASAVPYSSAASARRTSVASARRQWIRGDVIISGSFVGGDGREGVVAYVRGPSV